ncbi:hypothetical protein ScPMuIL_017357 [Solemya velum]
MDPRAKSSAMCKFLADNEDLSEFLKQLEGITRPDGNGLISDIPKFIETTSDELKKSVTGREKEIACLPVEDTVWFIEHLDTFCPDQEGLALRISCVKDLHGLFVSIYYGDPEEMTLHEQSYNAICQAALYPLANNPRRAKAATFKDPILAQQMPLDLSELGIQFLYHGGPRKETEEAHIRMRECIFCKFRGSQELFKRCSSCRAVLYCSKQCQKQDWVQTADMKQHSHKMWCAKMKTYMKKELRLKEFPFSLTEETTSPDFDKWHLRKFLERHGVYKQGFWRRECTDWIQPGHPVRFGDLPNDGDGVVLPVEMTVLDESPSLPVPVLADWESYFRYRGLRLDSPIAILLQFPLTLYHIIQHCLPNSYSSWWETVDESELRIDILGVEKEVEMLQLFQETGLLMPDKSLDIHMFGQKVSKAVDELEKNYRNVKITVHKKLYHNKKSIRKPHVVVGFNAGIGAYASWSDTMKLLKEEKIPAFFTDYCQYSCEGGNIIMQKLGLGTTSSPVINPFRSPVRRESEETDMPWYSNGFLYYLRYDNWTSNLVP